MQYKWVRDSYYPEECIAHENYKNAVLKAKDRATVMTGLTTGHPVRIIDIL